MSCDETSEAELARSENMDMDMDMDIKPVETTARKAKSAHSQIEAKYRSNLNTRFEILAKVLPKKSSPTMGRESDDVEDLVTAKPKKADILTSATTYVRETQKRMRIMEEESEALKARIDALKKMVKCEDCWLLDSVKTMKLMPDSPPEDGPVDDIMGSGHAKEMNMSGEYGGRNSNWQPPGNESHQWGPENNCLIDD